MIGVLLLDRNQVLVADGQTNELRLFSRASGEHLRTFGGFGQGPGEIEHLWQVWRATDGVIAEDAAGKASVFTLDGRYLRTMPRVVSDQARRVDRLGVRDHAVTKIGACAA